MPCVVLAVGSNTNREINISSAVAALRTLFGPIQVSPVYESQSIENKRWYYNLVLKLESQQSYAAIKEELKKIEFYQNRERDSHEVTIDLDLLLYGDIVSREVPLPHPDILSKAYVLRPLVDLMPESVHRIQKRTYRELWQLTFGGRTHTQEQAPTLIDFTWPSSLASQLEF